MKTWLIVLGTKPVSYTHLDVYKRQIIYGRITVATVDHTIAGVEALVGMTTGTKVTMTIIELTEAGVEVRKTTDE